MLGMEKQIGIGIIGHVDAGRSASVEIELMKLRDRGINIVMVDDLLKEKESDMVEDFINQVTNLRKIEPLPGMDMIVNGFSPSETEKAIAKKEWKQMTYEERKRLKG